MVYDSKSSFWSTPIHSMSDLANRLSPQMSRRARVVSSVNIGRPPLEIAFMFAIPLQGSIGPEDEIVECVLELFSVDNQLLTFVLYSVIVLFGVGAATLPFSHYSILTSPDSDADGSIVSITKLSNTFMSTPSMVITEKIKKNTKKLVAASLRLKSNVKPYKMSTFCLRQGCRSQASLGSPESRMPQQKQPIKFVII